MAPERGGSEATEPSWACRVKKLSPVSDREARKELLLECYSACYTLVAFTEKNMSASHDNCDDIDIPAEVRKSTHLLRTRIRTVDWDWLCEVAAEETERTGRHTTVSDLVRAAIQNHLMAYVTLSKLDAILVGDDEMLLRWTRVMVN